MDTFTDLPKRQSILTRQCRFALRDYGQRSDYKDESFIRRRDTMKKLRNPMTRIGNVMKRGAFISTKNRICAQAEEKFVHRRMLISLATRKPRLLLRRLPQRLGYEHNANHLRRFTLKCARTDHLLHSIKL